MNNLAYIVKDLYNIGLRRHEQRIIDTVLDSPGFAQPVNCKSYFGFLFCYTLPSVLRAQQKWRVLSAIIRGTRDGLRSRPTRWIAPKAF